MKPYGVKNNLHGTTHVRLKRRTHQDAITSLPCNVRTRRNLLVKYFLLCISVLTFKASSQALAPTVPSLEVKINLYYCTSPTFTNYNYIADFSICQYKFKIKRPSSADDLLILVHFFACNSIDLPFPSEIEPRNKNYRAK